MDPGQTFQEAQQAFHAGDWARALSLFEQVVKYDKKNEEIHTAMGFCAARLGRCDDGRRFLAKAIKLKPMSPEAHTQLGYLEAAASNNDRALNHYQRAVAVKPGHPGAVFGLVDVLRKIGDYEEAQTVLDKAMALRQEPHPQLTDALALIAVKTGQVERALDEVRRTLETDLDDGRRSIMLFRLADMLNAQGAYEDAFDAAEEACRLKNVPWDTAGYDREVERYLEVWTQEVFERQPRMSESGDQHVFIVGMPRSGTSLIEQIIASHPEASGVGELPAMVTIASGLQFQLSGAHGRLFTKPDRLTGGMLEECAASYVQQLHALAELFGVSTGLRRIADKQPHNFGHIPLIRLMFPETRIVHLERDPRDVAVSCFFQGFDGPMGYCYDLFALGKYIAHETRIVRHAQEVLGIEILRVRYEDLVSQPEGEVRRLLAHLGLDFREECLRFYETRREVRTASTDQVREPMYTGSRDRWKRYESRLGRLFEGFEAAGFDPDVRD